jgi:hypothetical protein
MRSAALSQFACRVRSPVHDKGLACTFGELGDTFFARSAAFCLLKQRGQFRQVRQPVRTGPGLFRGLLKPCGRLHGVQRTGTLFFPARPVI